MSDKPLSFQDIILNLQKFWSEHGCTILQPYDLEMGAGTFHPATALYAVSSRSDWNVAYVQPTRRPADSRFANHPNRTQHYYQFQVLMKPAPVDIQSTYLDSLAFIGIDSLNDIRFIEDDWKSPALGAWGLGWEIQCNGMEISQFTYMQQIAGKICSPPVLEITYGLERVAMYVQGVESFGKIVWNNAELPVLYEDIDFPAEREFSAFNVEYADVTLLKRHFQDYYDQCELMVKAHLPIVAYDFCAKASHMFNLLDSRGALSVIERESNLSKIKYLAKICCEGLLKKQKVENV
ncbi:glycine--tRNA ligase subunit alpha [Candidatus Sneabacter namystus]|uniref:Glycine--tRNA ligase alpha subunit n=1 Tax=Candidatus Sneabacter namystus TaxID=2601646 RepID=A0A5C0UIB3_9RICK|nr:glycine--tRNA ligase subunit alpha [Candidatus Sneabacter namystus]QEK39480.1 glycine--tRNA ligase subunit alpha [Candidatus Sneabacter namystus]